MNKLSPPQRIPKPRGVRPYVAYKALKYIIDWEDYLFLEHDKRLTYQFLHYSGIPYCEDEDSYCREIFVYLLEHGYIKQWNDENMDMKQAYFWIEPEGRRFVESKSPFYSVRQIEYWIDVLLSRGQVPWYYTVLLIVLSNLILWVIPRMFQINWNSLFQSMSDLLSILLNLTEILRLLLERM